MKIHQLDCDPVIFQSIYNGVRSFDIQINDREYKVGDALYFKEYNREKQSYSGRWISKRITYLVEMSRDYNLNGAPNLVVMAIV